ncbi:MAG TPA: fluoride efflux transporter CrcB [Gemmatimonadaceae bacterium]|nr:fluoride efflux transporter CrcB [Gemmatimonadaceae bacterium]
MLWYVAAGSALGGVTRFLLGGYLQRAIGTPFPGGTLVINVTGSFLLGFLLRYALGTASVTPEVRALLTTGFCGGYTTFSTFSYDAVTLAEDGSYARLVLYVTASVLLSVAAAFLGVAVAREALALRDG